MKFELGGFTCYRGFETNGSLFVFGPDEAEELLRAYYRKYGPYCMDKSLLDFLASIPPLGKRHLTRKKHAVLHLLVLFREEIKNGMGISAHLVQDVLATIEHVRVVE
jgi:hypothetical protein